jgi:hypothetical protein
LCTDWAAMLWNPLLPQFPSPHPIHGRGSSSPLLTVPCAIPGSDHPLQSSPASYGVILQAKIGRRVSSMVEKGGGGTQQLLGSRNCDPAPTPIPSVIPDRPCNHPAPGSSRLSDSPLSGGRIVARPVLRSALKLLLQWLTARVAEYEGSLMCNAQASIIDTCLIHSIPQVS